MQAGNPVKDLAALKRAVRDDVIPLLEEYSYEDYATLAAILGEELVDVNSQRICHELFDEGHEEELIQALLAPSPDMAASSEAMQSEEASVEDEHLMMTKTMKRSQRREQHCYLDYHVRVGNDFP